MNKNLLLQVRSTATEIFSLKAVEESGWQIYTAADSRQAQALIREHSFPIGFVELSADTDDELLDWVSRLCQLEAGIHWLALLPRQCLTSRRIRELLLSCFCDFHILPVDSRDILATIAHANEIAKLAGDVEEGPTSRRTLAHVLGRSEVMRNVELNLRKFARTDAPVLLTGESGTGKELAARIIHDGSARAGELFIAVNCAALQPTLIQSELFGHERGAFTGAHQRRIGHIEAAAGGSILLDEVGDLPMDLQVNLLRFLEEGYIERVGSVARLKVDVRVIAATNIDLEQAVDEGRFREDLYYRLNVLHQELPPLRMRGGDLELLALQFFERFRSESDATVRGFTMEAFRVMRRHDWPGNVRELINRVRRAVVMCDNRLIGPNDLGLERRTGRHWLPTLREARAIAEQQSIQASLRCNSENISEAARQLGISRARLYELMRTHGIVKESEIPAHHATAVRQQQEESGKTRVSVVQD
jgi:DNA-binding NtrC family response regulator